MPCPGATIELRIAGDTAALCNRTGDACERVDVARQPVGASSAATFANLAISTPGSHDLAATVAHASYGACAKALNASLREITEFQKIATLGAFG